MRTKAQILAAGIAGLLLLVPAPALGAADLSVVVESNPPSQPFGNGGTVEVKITIANAGPDAALDVTGGSTAGSPQLELQSALPSQGTVDHQPANDPPIHYEAGTIPSESVVTIGLMLEEAQTGLATFDADVTTTTPESSLANNAASATVRLLAMVPSANPLSFGSRPVGGSSSEMFSLVNRAAVPIRVDGVLLAPLDFSAPTDGCTGATVVPGGSCPMTLDFAPIASGDRPGTLTITSSTPNVVPSSVLLQGTGTIVPDRTAATLRLEGVPNSVKASRFRKGLSVKVTPSEPAALDVSLAGKARAGALASAFDLELFSSSLPLAGGTRTVKVKPKGRLLGPLRKKFKVRLLVAATDASGNESSSSRTITVRPGR
jgi:Domain of unknown function DUF11